MKIHIIENNEFEEIDYIASYINERISKKCGKEVEKCDKALIKKYTRTK